MTGADAQLGVLGGFLLTVGGERRDVSARKVKALLWDASTAARRTRRWSVTHQGSPLEPNLRRSRTKRSP
jgi:hypothetical protein